MQLYTKEDLEREYEMGVRAGLLIQKRQGRRRVRGPGTVTVLQDWVAARITDTPDDLIPLPRSNGIP